MANMDVVDLDGKKVGSLELSDEIFGPEAINEDLMWEAVKHYRAALRQGTHATKNRKLVSGSGKKLWKQKGTGRARVASIRSPLWRSGGTVHGPQPRSYDYPFPRKKGLGALRSAIASKLADGQLILVENLELNEPKTKLYRAAMKTLQANKTALLVESGASLSRNLLLGARNLEGVELILGNEVHPYDLLRHERVIFSRAAMEQLQEALGKAVSRRKRIPAAAEVA